MQRVPLSEELSDFDLRDFTVPTLVDKRGFLYILHDASYPEYVKVGRTSDVKKRLTGYNSDKPYSTARMMFISKLFGDVSRAERQVLDYLYENTAPTTLTKEWFRAEHLEKIKDIIERAEEKECTGILNSETPGNTRQLDAASRRSPNPES